MREEHYLRLIALLSFYEESASLLADSISRVAALGVTHLIACDGRYDLAPGERENSGPDASAAVLGAMMMGFTSVDLIKKSDATWSGNEVEKRNYMLERALAVAEEGDWLLVFDADHLWSAVDGFDLGAALSASGLDVARVKFADGKVGDEPAWYTANLLYRAVPGMYYDRSHWLIRYPDGSAVTALAAGAADGDKWQLDLTASVSVWHAVHEQPPERRARQTVYYENRDAAGVERRQRRDYEEEM